MGQPHRLRLPQLFLIKPTHSETDCPMLPFHLKRYTRRLATGLAIAAALLAPTAGAAQSAMTKTGSALVFQPAIGWYAPSFAFYNQQYRGLDDIPFTNDVANSYRLPEIGSGREFAFELRYRRFSGRRIGVGLSIGSLDTGIRSALDDPPKPGDTRRLTYEHKITLLPLLATVYLYLPVSTLAEIYLGQGAGAVRIEESVQIIGENGLEVFVDGSRATGLVFQPVAGIQHTFAADSYLFAEIAYVLGGYSAQGWQPPRDPFKSIFLRRGSVSLSGPRIRLGLGFRLRLQSAAR